MEPHMRVATLLIATWAAFMPGLAQADAGCGVPSAGEDHWPVAAPESVGLAGATLCSMVKWLDGSKESNVHAVLAVRRGTLVFEHYFSGSDQIWGRPIGDVTFGPNTRHDERSASKSITALLLGIAIDRGLIKGIDAPVLSFFPEYADLATPAKDRITLRHLITMSAGLEWQELDIPYTTPYTGDGIRVWNAPDPYRYTLEKAVVAPPGRVWNYSSGSTELIGAVLKKTTGKPVDELARAWLFAPLGITDVEWPQVANGAGASGTLRLRPRDLAKVGQLVLQHGVWNDAQVVPAAWVEAATSPQVAVPGFSSFFYGYQFWLGRSLIDKRAVEWAAAIGLGGQRVSIVPALDLVVVVNAGLYASPPQAADTAAIVNQYVLEATTSHRD
jgi:CubicO group peptidase (beta-lactamase class C family)